MKQPTSFYDKFQDEPPREYFFHEVDEDARTLRVQVLGANISQIFKHSPSPTKKSITKLLDRKTTGFLATVTASGKRIVLAWAESGHGMGEHGDSLVAQDQVLNNKKWALRAIKLAKVLEINMGSPLDSGRSKSAVSGQFQASHVEAKLAAHAATLLIRLARDSGAEMGNCAMTRENLSKLRHARWKDGSPLHFEIDVSRKNCVRCGLFLERLQDLTGIRFELKWRQRLVKIEYQRQALVTLRRSGGKTKPTELSTYEKDGVIYYVSPEGPVDGSCAPSQGTETRQSASKGAPSPYHLSSVDKPLPATPVTEAPYWDGETEAKRQETEVPAGQSEESLLFPVRLPRPYAIILK